MENRPHQLQRAARDAEIVTIFYAGHGIAVDGDNRIWLGGWPNTGGVAMNLVWASWEPVITTPPCAAAPATSEDSSQA